MLRIKYFEEFKGDQPFVVILADKQALKMAYDFFKDKQGALLNDRTITEFSDVSSLEDNRLYLTPDECQEIAQHFKNLHDSPEPGHAYFDTETLGDEIEIIISHMEYTDLF